LTYYFAYGLRIQSDISLPELEPIREDSCDVSITVMEGNPPVDSGLGGDLEVLAWDEVGTFLVSGGTTVRAYLHEDVDDELARLPILGPVLGTILHQRGHIVLHASAVSIDGGVVAFIGHKGYGKSTTAAALHDRGHALVTDDLLPIVLSEEQGPRTWPGYGRMSVWPESAKAVGSDPNHLQSLHQRVRKKALPASNRIDPREAVPLKAIYVLGRGGRPACKGLSAREEFVAVLRHSYCSSQLAESGADALPPLFRQFTQLVEEVPIRRLERTDDLNLLPVLVRLIEHDVQSAPSRSPTLPRPSAASASISPTTPISRL